MLLIAVRPALPHYRKVGGEVRTRADATLGGDHLGQVGRGHAKTAVGPVEGDDLGARREGLHAQVLVVEIAVHEGPGHAGGARLEPIPVLVQLVEPCKEAVEKRQVAGSERWIVEVLSDEISRAAHLLTIAGWSGVGQLRLVGSGGACFGVEGPKPAARGPTMLRQKCVVRLAMDLPDEEPAGLLLRAVVRVCDDSMEAGPGERHTREDLLVHGAREQAIVSRAPLGDDGRTLGAGAIEPVYRPGPRLAHLVLLPGDPVGHRAIVPKSTPRLDGGVGQQLLQTPSRRCRRP